MKNEKLIFGKVISLNTRNKIFEAIWIKDGIIKFIGTKKLAKQLASKDVEIIDYKNNFIYPGFMDAHCHGFYAGAKMAFFENLNSGQNLKDYLTIMKKRMQFDKDAPFYVGAGFIARTEIPTHQMLDEICNDKPMILITADGHSVWMNSKAMEKFEINKEAVKKWGTDIVRIDKNGNPTGYISEGPNSQIIKQLTCDSVESIKRSILKWQEFAFSVGLTGYYEAGINEMIAQAYKELNDEGKLKIKVFAGWLMNEWSKDYLKDVDLAYEASKKYNCENFKIIGMKIFMDGVIEAHTAWLDKPYLDDPKYTGVKRFKDLDRTAQLIAYADSKGFNVHCHAIGDGAGKFALDAIEKAQLQTGDMDQRNAIAHIQLLKQEDIVRLTDLNVTAVVAPLWMYKEPDYVIQEIEYIGPRREFYSYPLKSFVINDGTIAFHSDYPVSPEINPALSIYMACERNYPDKELFLQLNPHECVSREEAIYGLTIGPALSVKQEHNIGYMLIGHQANFSVFNKNFLSCEINQIPKAKLIATVVDGQEVYKNKKEAI